MTFKECYIIKYLDDTLEFACSIPSDLDPNLVFYTYKLVCDSDKIRLEAVNLWQ